MIRKAIRLLEPREKEIILDRYFKNKTQTEIAEELGISQAQVSRLEKNALKSMYDIMK
jgi:RNA polymerase sporulation-specific sigma factor